MTQVFVEQPRLHRQHLLLNYDCFVLLRYLSNGQANSFFPCKCKRPGTTSLVKKFQIQIKLQSNFEDYSFSSILLPYLISDLQVALLNGLKSMI